MSGVRRASNLVFILLIIKEFLFCESCRHTWWHTALRLLAFCSSLFLSQISRTGAYLQKGPPSHFSRRCVRRGRGGLVDPRSEVLSPPYRAGVARGRQRLGCWWPPARGVWQRPTPRLGTALHGMESARCWPVLMPGCWGCSDTTRLFLRCSTCSGVPSFLNPLIYKRLTDGARRNTDSVPACSKVFHVFRFKHSRRDREQAENPRQPWFVACLAARQT